MFLGSYRFDGAPDTLLAAYDRLMASVGGAVTLQVCVVDDDGITVYDTCPTRSEFESFSTSPDFVDSVRAAGLPQPRVTPLGRAHAVRTAAGPVA